MLRSYSIEDTVNDLQVLILKLNLCRFHLYGHSFGGIIAFEYMKQVQNQRNACTSVRPWNPSCLSVILCSTPYNIQETYTESQRLLSVLRKEEDDDTTLIPRFRQKHLCRTSDLPVFLQNAYSNSGKIWFGMDIISHYVAEPFDAPRSNESIPPALILRGEHDFVTDECARKWENCFHEFGWSRIQTLIGCSHYGLLEDGKAYVNILSNFVSEHDEHVVGCPDLDALVIRIELILILCAKS